MKQRKETHLRFTLQTNDVIFVQAASIFVIWRWSHEEQGGILQYSILKNFIDLIKIYTYFLCFSYNTFYPFTPLNDLLLK